MPKSSRHFAISLLKPQLHSICTCMLDNCLSLFSYMRTNSSAEQCEEKIHATNLSVLGIFAKVFFFKKLTFLLCSQISIVSNRAFIVNKIGKQPVQAKLLPIKYAFPFLQKLIEPMILNDRQGSIQNEGTLSKQKQKAAFETQVSFGRGFLQCILTLLKL